MEDIIKRIAADWAVETMKKLPDFETEEEKDAYMEGITDVMKLLKAMSEKVEAEKEKSLHHPALDDIISAFLEDEEEDNEGEN